MFVSHKLKCVYMAPPRTGTTSIRCALELLGGEPFVYPFKEDPAVKHECHLPKYLEDYFIFASVRNPYSRQISRFLENWQNKNTPTQDDFRQYTFGEKTNQKFSCCGWLNLLGGYQPPQDCVPFKIHHFVRLENIEDDFYSMPFVTKKIIFPHDNKCKFDNLDIKLTMDISYIVYKSMKCDFDTFNYRSFIAV